MSLLEFETMNPYIIRKILKKRGTLFEEKEDYIVTEKKVRVSVNGKEVVNLYCTPSMVKELIIAFFLTEGIIKGTFCAEEIDIEYGDDITVDIPVE